MAERAEVLEAIVAFVRARDPSARPDADDPLIRFVPPGERPVRFLLELEDALADRFPGVDVDLDDRPDDVTLRDLADLVVEQAGPRRDPR